MAMEIIRRLYQEQRYDEALVEVESQLERARECAHLWVIRGNLIQLSEECALTLEDAEQSYLKALDIDPDSVEAMEELIHFYYAVMDDKVKARALVDRLDTKLARLTGGIQNIRLWLDAKV